MTDYLVIGAGLAGIAFASDIQAAGATVRVLDKGRGVGGRMATRRLNRDGQTLIVDHGAQFFTARTTRLKNLVEQWCSDGWLNIWSYGFPLWKDGQINERPAGHPRYAPRNGMNTLAKTLATGLDIKTSATVTRIEQTDNGYRAITSDGEEFSGRSLILNLPPTQLLALASGILPSETVTALQSVEFLPAWTLIATLQQDIPNANWQALEFEEHPVLGLLSRDHTKREIGGIPTLVAHASGIWSREHLEDSPEAVQVALSNAIIEVFGPLEMQMEPVHRWRYALPVKTIEKKYLWNAERHIGCCGDWCGGPRVEGALESGWNLAENIMKNLPQNAVNEG